MNGEHENARLSRFNHDKRVPPRTIEGSDDFTTRASKRLAYVQTTDEEFTQKQDFDNKFSPPRKKDYHTMDMKKLIGPQ